MGEQPIFSTKAHVFQIDPNTKKKWLPTSSQAVNVSYYYDSTRNTYRIISVDGSKAVINSTITPNMTFTKTSVKFGQWTDPRANTVYGLGFGTEAELTKFVEKFKEIKELLRQSGSGQHSSPAHTNGTPPTSNSPAPEAPNLMQAEVTGSMPSPLNSPKPSPALITQSESIHNSGSTTPSLGSSSNQVVEQLKYENDRLKIALAQSSANAKKWEVELNTLKNNNVRLTTALQESTSNVEEWKRQLASYKEEGARMKKKVLESEKAGGNSELLQRQLNDTRDKVNDMERQKNSKDEEVQQLTRRLEDMKLIDSQKQKLNERIQALERENENIRKQLTESKEQGDSIRSLQIRDRQQLRSVQEQLGSKLNELYGLNDKLAELTQQSGHS